MTARDRFERAASLLGPFGRRLTGLALALLLGCQAAPTPPETAGSILVNVVTTGEDLDADGFTVTIGSVERSLPTSGSATVEGLSPGSYDVTLSGWAANCSVVGEPMRSVALAEGQQAEAVFEVECVFDAAGVALVEVSCPALVPAATEGLPLDLIPIGSVPDDLTAPVMARASWADGPAVTLGLVLEEGGNANLMVPLHPTGSLEGGTVTVRVSDQTGSCPPFDLDIQPLAAAPGELAALVDIAQELIDAQAILFETTREELISTPATSLEPALLPLAIAQALVDEDSNDASLRALLDGRAPDFGPDELDFAERLLARTGLRADLAAERDEVVTSGPAEGGTRSTAHASPTRAPSPGLAIDCILTGEMDAALLDECMTLGRDKRQGAASQATQENAIFAMDVAATLGSRRIARPIASLITFSQLYDAALAGNLPSEFDRIEVAPAPAAFQEDQPGPGTWAPARVWATSLGWDVRQLFATVIAGQITPDIRPTRRLSRFERYVARRGATGDFQTIEQVEGFFQGLLDQLVQALVGRGVALSDDALTVPPLTYGPVDITDTEWSDARIVTGAAIELTPHETFEPVEPGTSLLEVTTAVGRFGGTSIATEHLPIIVRELGISISPPEVVLQAGEEATFAVTVTDALHPENVELIAGQPMQGSAQLTLGTGAAHTVTYTAPQGPTPNSTDIVAVEHVGEEGARGRSDEVRTASATIRFGGVEIVPVTECVSPGQEVQLRAVITGFDPEPDLVWSTSAGSITGDGVFTAPDQTGDVTVNVSLAGHSNVADSLVIPVGGCVCSFTLQVGNNPAYVGQPGDEVAYFSAEGSVPGEPTAVGYVTFSGVNDLSAVAAVEVPTVAVTGPGDFPLSTISGGLGYGGPDDFFTNVSPPQGTLRIFEYDAHSVLTGEVLGGVVEDAFGEGPEYGFSAVFQIYPPAGSTGWEYSCTITEQAPQ